MRKFLMVVVGCAMAYSLAFGEEAKVVKREYTLKDTESPAMTGMLKGVMPSDLSRPNTGMVMTTDDGRDVEFEVRPAAPVYDGATGALVSLKAVPSGSKIRVNYHESPAGKLQAVAVKVLPKEEAKKVPVQQPAPKAANVPGAERLEETMK